MRTTTTGLVTTVEACAAADVTYRQVDQWIRLGAITPFFRGVGSGSRHAFSPAEVERLVCIGRAALAVWRLSEVGVAVATVARWWQLLAADGPVVDRVGVITVTLRGDTT